MKGKKPIKESREQACLPLIDHRSDCVLRSTQHFRRSNAVTNSGQPSRQVTLQSSNPLRNPVGANPSYRSTHDALLPDPSCIAYTNYTGTLFISTSSAPAPATAACILFSFFRMTTLYPNATACMIAAAACAWGAGAVSGDLPRNSHKKRGREEETTKLTARLPPDPSPAG